MRKIEKSSSPHRQGSLHVSGSEPISSHQKARLHFLLVAQGRPTATPPGRIVIICLSVLRPNIGLDLDVPSSSALVPPYCQHRLIFRPPCATCASFFFGIYYTSNPTRLRVGLQRLCPRHYSAFHVHPSNICIPAGRKRRIPRSYSCQKPHQNRRCRGFSSVANLCVVSLAFGLGFFALCFSEGLPSEAVLWGGNKFAALDRETWLQHGARRGSQNSPTSLSPYHEIYILLLKHSSSAHQRRT